MFNKKTLTFALIIALVYSSVDYEGLKTCFNNCVSAHKTACDAQTGNSAGNVPKDTIAQEAYEYHLCVHPYETEAEFKAAYCSTVTLTTPNPAITQSGYCKYFWNGIDETEINQSQLFNAYQECFINNDCQYTDPEAGHDNSDGTSVYTTTFKSCIETCGNSARNKAELNFKSCTDLCGSAPTWDYSVELEKTYIDCTTSAACGYLDFLTFADYQYQDAYNSCYNDCDSAYTGNSGADAGKKTYLECRAKCPFPDASTYERIDNSYTQADVTRLAFSILLLFVAYNFAIFA